MAVQAGGRSVARSRTLDDRWLHRIVAVHGKRRVLSRILETHAGSVVHGAGARELHAAPATVVRHRRHVVHRGNDDSEWRDERRPPVEYPDRGHVLAAAHCTAIAKGFLQY